MILRNESPEARVGRAIAIVAHHPVIVLLEGVFRSDFSVNEDLIVLNLERVALKLGDARGIDGQFFQFQCALFAFLGNPNAVGSAVIGSCPVLSHIDGVETVTCGFR